MYEFTVSRSAQGYVVVTIVPLVRSRRREDRGHIYSFTREEALSLFHELYAALSSPPE